MSDADTPDPLLHLRLTISVACLAAKLCDKEVGRYAQHYGRTVRAVNESWGAATREWKSWWALHSLLNLTEHANGRHEKCGEFLHYSRCCDGTWRPPQQKPRERYWSDITSNPAEPANIACLATVLVNAFTCSPHMRKYAGQSIQFGRTAPNESLCVPSALPCSVGSLD